MPPMHAGRTLDQAVLDEIVRRIVAVAQPEQIIPFGSAARGETGRHSDVDLLVVKDGGRGYLYYNTLYAIIPGVAIFLAVLSLNIVGDSLRDRVDPRDARLIKEDNA